MAGLSDIYVISGAGLQAQTARLRVVAQNIANAQTTPTSPDQDPYRRQIVTFKNELDRATGVTKIKVAGVTEDKSDFGARYDPANPGADAQGYVRTPNVNMVIESMDLRQAQRSYDANLNVLEAGRVMLLKTIEILK